MENSSQKRALVFIDGSNFYYKLKELTAAKAETLKLLEFNYRTFTEKLVKDHTLIETRYYIGAIKKQNGPTKEKSEKMYANQQRLIAKLQQQNIPVILGNLIQHPDKSFHEKGVDIRIAVEMIRFAIENRYDTAYLLSSDTDLVPAVEEVRLLKKRVVYVGISKGQSFGLTKTSNETILLRNEDIMPHFLKLSKTTNKRKKVRTSEP